MNYLDPQVIALLVAIVVCLIILALAYVVVRALWSGAIDLRHLLSESSAANPGTAPADPPKASLSRFQFLVFTFVIAGLYLVLSLETGTLIEIPGDALILLGISSATYVAGKAISDKKPETTTATGAAALTPLQLAAEADRAAKLAERAAADANAAAARAAAAAAALVPPTAI